MGPSLTDREMRELAGLGAKISAGLGCNVNDSGVPCVTDRLDAVTNMIQYLELHDYVVTKRESVEELS